MGRDFIPRQNAVFLRWSATFADRLAQDPGAYGVPPDLVAEYQILNAAYAEAFRRASWVDTRTRITVVQRDACRAEAVAMARRLAGIVQRHPGVNDEQRMALGLTVPTAHRRRIPRPDEKPMIRVRSMIDNDALRVSLGRRPAGAATACVYLHLAERHQGVTAMSADDLPVAMTVSRTRFVLPVPPGPAAVAWVSARWLSPRGEPGPMSTPVAKFLPFRMAPPKSATMNRAA